MKNKEGEYNWHLVRALPIQENGETLVKWFGTCTNIEEQKRAEQARIPPTRAGYL